MTEAKTRRTGVRLSLGAALVTVLATLLVAAPADAATPIPPPATTKVSNAYVSGNCRFTPTRADAPPGFVKARFTAAARWNGRVAYDNITQLNVTCYRIFSGALPVIENTVDFVGVSEPGRTAYVTKTTMAPVEVSYKVCMVVTYTLKDGGSGGTSSSDCYFLPPA